MCSREEVGADREGDNDADRQGDNDRGPGSHRAHHPHHSHYRLLLPLPQEA